MMSERQKYSTTLFNLAGTYLEGVFVDKNIDTAISLYRMAHATGGTGTRSYEMLSSLGISSEFSYGDRIRLEQLFKIDSALGDISSDNPMQELSNFYLGTTGIVPP